MFKENKKKKSRGSIATLPVDKRPKVFVFVAICAFSKITKGVEGI